ncbi:hypothetical protein EF903_06880 [Streptomyces sp. WAC05292]|uniref:hypothetical protein n=1 Tax=Streptomyces sp. WAC05292 TaxID=2487418 RepID=UPI000F73C751|nr:hypothetical protein [Streptomyces sp. WAC05292]RSS94256.1 hypothetical protein EF903_06880 [Streptomyces sp. WAC05292]
MAAPTWRRDDVVLRISAKEAARYPGLRARLGAERLPTNRLAQARPTAPAVTARPYVEWDLAAEIGEAPHWVLELPDMVLINANEARRWHWAKERKVAAAIRSATATLARTKGIPQLNRARVLYVVHPRTRTRVFDPSNWSLSAKAAVDGLSDAGVFEDDNAAIVTGVDPRAGTRQDGAHIRMSLVIVDQGKGNEDAGT